MRFGVALGSGGARGLAHVGVLSVLEENGIEPHCISGTSMGAIVGALYADLLDADEVAHRIQIFTEDPQFKANWEPFLDTEPPEETASFFQGLRRSIHRKFLNLKTFTAPSQQSEEPLLEPLKRMFGDRSIEELKLPFAAVAVDLLSGEPRVFRNGNLVEALYASGAIPGIFPPLSIDGQLLIDGGGAYRVPVSVCRSLGADFVLAADIPSFAPEKEDYKTGLEIMMRMDQITRSRLNKFVLREADFVVRPDVGPFHWAQFHAFTEIRGAGEAAMRDALSELRPRLEETTGLRKRLATFLNRIVKRGT